MYVEHNGKILKAKEKGGLITLDLSNKKVIYISGIRGLEDLKDLQEFILTKNKIRIIEGLENFKNLKKINLSRNLIREIQGLENLTNLEELDLSFNDITSIKGLENLKNLKILDLSFNNITSIKGLENLKNLEVLLLKRNKVSEIKGLENLEKLRNIDLLLNPILKLASKKFGGDKSGRFKHPQQLVEYCKRSLGIPEKIEQESIKPKELETIQPKEPRKKQKVLLNKLQHLFEISERVKISDVVKLIDTTREGLLDFLVTNYETLGGMKIDGDFLKVSSTEDVNKFMNLLDQQFDSWESKEKTKEGKKLPI
ncbi:MAG: leucine-rich repeat domain-containing protein [Promethearchaeota archaeon]